MSKAAVKPAKKSFADFDMDAMDFSAVPANTEFKAAGRFQRLPLADIDPDPAQVRREFDQAEIDALAATIKDRGLLQPIVVAPTSNGRYIIRYGERRYRACRQLGFDQIDTVLDQADAERYIGLDQCLENEQRQALSLAERVSFIASRVSDTLSTKDLAARIAKPHSEVKRLYSLRTLPEDILAALKNCSPRAAVAIKHAIELDEKATRNVVVTNENPTAADRKSKRLNSSHQLASPSIPTRRFTELSLSEPLSFIAILVLDMLSTKDLAAPIAKPHSEVKRLSALRTLPEDILAALKNCSPRAAVAIKHAIELDEKATRNFVVTNENPTAAACEQFLATLQGGPDEESAQAGAAKPNDDSALPQESRAPVDRKSTRLNSSH